MDFAFEEIDDLQLAVERLLAVGATGQSVTLSFEVVDGGVRGRVAPLREDTISAALADGEMRAGHLTLRRILDIVLDSFEVEDAGGQVVAVRLEKRKHPA